MGLLDRLFGKRKQPAPQIQLRRIVLYRKRSEDVGKGDVPTGRDAGQVLSMLVDMADRLNRPVVNVFRNEMVSTGTTKCPVGFDTYFEMDDQAIVADAQRECPHAQLQDIFTAKTESPKATYKICMFYDTTRTTPRPVSCELCGSEACYRVLVSDTLERKVVCSDCGHPGMIARPL